MRKQLFYLSLTMLTPTVLVNDLGKTFLTHTTFSGYQYRQIGRRHLYSNVYRTHQCFIVANDAES